MLKRFLILALVVLLTALVVKNYKMAAASMAPTVLLGDYVLVDKLTYHWRAPAFGEVVMFKFPEDETKLFVKRIIGMPGDMIEITDKFVYLNGKRLPDEGFTQRMDPGVIPGNLNPRDNLGPVIVPEDSYFVMGDNRDQSLDSRFFGPVHRSKITGKVRVVYWSWGESLRWARIGSLIH